jgi:glutamine synthetase
MPRSARELIAAVAAPLLKVHFKYLQSVTLAELEQAVDDGAVDTVLLAMTDMQGRPQGKRLTAAHFRAEVVEHGAEGCNYLLAVDVEMSTAAGYATSSAERGYGDMLLVPDLGTCVPCPGTRGP